MIILCLTILTILLWIGYHITGALLAAIIWLCVKLPCRHHLCPQSLRPECCKLRGARQPPALFRDSRKRQGDEFEAALEARDCGDLFAYYDQDYNVLAETLDVMRGNALRMLWIGSALFALVAALFLLLSFRQTADPARKLRLLGVSAKRVRRQRCLAAVLLIAVASVLGAAGGSGLYGAVSTRILSSYVAMRPAALLVSTAAQAFLLLLAALVCTLATANQNLMLCRK